MLDGWMSWCCSLSCYNKLTGNMLHFSTNAAVKCELTLPALKGTTYDPAYRSFFPPGATVRVICGEKYGITTRQNTSAVSTCQDNGQWDIRPICQGKKLHKL